MLEASVADKDALQSPPSLKWESRPAELDVLEKQQITTHHRNLYAHFLVIISPQFSNEIDIYIKLEVQFPYFPPWATIFQNHG